MPFLAQIAGITLQVVQVCTPTPEYLAAKAAQMPQAQIMMIQPAKCVNTGNPLIGKKMFFMGITENSRRQCKQQQEYWDWVASKQKVTISSWCLIGR
jgi:hypothetical protein